MEYFITYKETISSNFENFEIHCFFHGVDHDDIIRLLSNTATIVKNIGVNSENGHL